MSVLTQKDAATEKRYLEVLKDNESLLVFMRNMLKFDQQFCKSMAAGADFTLRLEVRGVGGSLIHARVYTDEVDKLSAMGKD